MHNSNHELRNTPINSKTLFGKKIKEVAKGNFEAQQQRFLATSFVATTLQQQKMTYTAPPVFKTQKQPTKSGFHAKSKEIRFDTNTRIHLYRYGISNSTENSQSTREPSKSSYSD